MHKMHKIFMQSDVISDIDFFLIDKIIVNLCYIQLCMTVIIVIITVIHKSKLFIFTLYWYKFCETFNQYQNVLYFPHHSA